MGLRATEHSRTEAQARKHLEEWDRSFTKNLVASFLAFVWIGVGGFSVMPVGLLLALAILVPDIRQWSILRRIAFAGRRTLTLLSLCAASFLFAHAQIGIFDRGRPVSVSVEFVVPSKLGWIPRSRIDSDVAHRAACHRGSAEACALLARAHMYGDGEKTDPATAAAYYDLACHAGHAVSCVSLGRMYSRGIGVELDRGSAKRLYAKACDDGELVGCHNLGALYLASAHEGSGIHSLMRSCTEGFPRSCFLVGEHFRVGSSAFPKDPRRAGAWLQRACRHGVEEACESSKLLM
jgi:hypothetical protein